MSDYESNGQFLAEYFEVGCLCLITERINQPKSSDFKEKADYYMAHCTCSRHPESAKMDCWDRKIKTSNPEIAKQARQLS